jgi:monofunctional biosynthetic peptidoglycan transglycosylase
VRKTRARVPPKFAITQVHCRPLESDTLASNSIGDTAGSRSLPAADDQSAGASSGCSSWRSLAEFVIWRAARWTLVLIAASCTVLLTLVVVYRWIKPPTSSLILGQYLTGKKIDQRWVPLERISPHLIKAVILSEDAKFCRHFGIDWAELEAAFERTQDGSPRGGSTISMQVAKNLFLWSSRSYLRKAIELPLTLILEALWPKRRILEIYLNVAEWGPGVFGAEAAAIHHFNKPAAWLTPREAALLAVVLPNPYQRVAGAPGPGTQRRADRLMERMRVSVSAVNCVKPPQRANGTSAGLSPAMRL